MSNNIDRVLDLIDGAIGPEESQMMRWRPDGEWPDEQSYDEYVYEFVVADEDTFQMTLAADCPPGRIIFVPGRDFDIIDDPPMEVPLPDEMAARLTVWQQDLIGRLVATTAEPVTIFTPRTYRASLIHWCPRS